ncbi:hypothetical protein JXQ31_01090 [candidate division KSB1 bacterium]|nr:hypothetical protein [candidate division KSB1 bacterium]
MTRKTYISAVFILSCLFYFAGCGHQVLIKTDQVQKEQSVNIVLKSGEKYSGTVSAIEGNTITILDKNNIKKEIQKQTILNIYGPQPYYDSNGKLISEKEIAQNKTNEKFWLFTVSGGALSAGVSFFLSSMIARSQGEDTNAPIITTGTITGTVIGGYLFSRLGSQKDKNNSIDKIRIARAGQKLNNVIEDKSKKDQLEQEIEKLRIERERQEAELQELRKKINQKSDN